MSGIAHREDSLEMSSFHLFISLSSHNPYGGGKTSLVVFLSYRREKKTKIKMIAAGRVHIYRNRNSISVMYTQIYIIRTLIHIMRQLKS